MRLHTDRAIEEASVRLGPNLGEEASTLQFRGPYRLYDDACDEGVWVKSVLGAFMPFVLTEVQHDREGDIQAWLFAHGDDRSVILTIWND
jgi:hypothetical protein